MKDMLNDLWQWKGMRWPTTIFSLFALVACAGAATIFDDDFNDTASVSQADLVAAVGTGTWVVIDVDSSTIQTGASRYLHLSRGDYDYTAVFSEYGSAAAGGTISLDLSFSDSVHDYNTISILEGTDELFRIEVQNDDGDTWIDPVTPNRTDAQINLVGATTASIGNGIKEGTTPNRTFVFTLDATGVDLSITGDGLGSALTASVDYARMPSIGPDRIRFFKNDLPQVGNTHKSDRGQLWIDNIEATFDTTDHQPATTIQGEVAITGWTGATHHDFWTEGNASGQGSVSNSLSETDSDGYGNTTPPFDATGNQTYNVTWADGEAASYRGDYLSAFNIYVDGTASANLDLNLTGAPTGSRAEGLVSAGFGGFTFDASDGNANGLINFDVNFTIDVTVDGPQVNGLHGVFVDAYSTDFSTATDLVTVGTPTVYSTYYDDTFDMVYSEIADSGDFAWFFAYADELVAAEPGGTISDTLTASFVFVPTTDLTTIFDYVELTAFALAEAMVSVPRPRLLNFTYDVGDGSSEITIMGEPGSAYRLVEASSPEFSTPARDPVPLDGAIEGALNGDIVTTDVVTGKARVQFNLGTTKTRTYLRARKN
jgi:hypothetical protein